MSRVILQGPVSAFISGTSSPFFGWWFQVLNVRIRPHSFSRVWNTFHLGWIVNRHTECLCGIEYMVGKLRTEIGKMHFHIIETFLVFSLL
jgi:hypothetical protein